MKKTVTLSEDEYNEMVIACGNKKDSNINVLFQYYYKDTRDFFSVGLTKPSISICNCVTYGTNGESSSITEAKAKEIQESLDVFKKTQFDALNLEFEAAVSELALIKSKWWYKLFAR